MAGEDHQHPQQASRSPVREALRDNFKEIPKVLAWVASAIVAIVLLGSIVTAIIGPLSDQDREALHAYRMAADWKLMAYPPRSADAPLAVNSLLTEVACEASRNHYLRRALDQGNALPDIHCEQTRSWTERTHMRLLAFRERWNTTEAPTNPRR